MAYALIPGAKHFAQQLQRPQYNTYDHVKVLGIFWEDGEDEYKIEARKLLSFLQHRFAFKDTVEFAIPSRGSYFATFAAVMKEVGIMCQSTKPDQRNLLILHYGGHGDEDSTPENSHRREAVWAA